MGLVLRFTPGPLTTGGSTVAFYADTSLTPLGVTLLHRGLPLSTLDIQPSPTSFGVQTQYSAARGSSTTVGAVYVDGGTPTTIVMVELDSHWLPVLTTRQTLTGVDSTLINGNPGAVSSVNTKTGAVLLAPIDLGAQPVLPPATTTFTTSGTAVPNVVNLVDASAASTDIAIALPTGLQPNTVLGVQRQDSNYPTRLVSVQGFFDGNTSGNTMRQLRGQGDLILLQVLADGTWHRMGGYVPTAVTDNLYDVKGAAAQAVAQLVGAAPAALDTIYELAAELQLDEGQLANLFTAVGLKAPLASPALTGTPTINGSNALSKAAGDATYDTLLPTAGGYSYNGDGTVSSTPQGKTYTYNSDSTVHTVTQNGVTRTYAYNADGTVASVT